MPHKIPHNNRRLLPWTLALAGLVWLIAVPTGSLLPTAHAATTFTVNSLGDTNDAAPGDGACADSSGACTLRAAIQEANSLAGDDTINFSVTGTIDLFTDQLAVTANVSINGPGSNLLTLRRAGGVAHRLFFVNAPAVTISGMTVREGIGTFPSGSGGGISNAGTLTLTDVVVIANEAGSGGSGSTNGGAGGGIDNSGTLTMMNCVVRDNRSGAGTLGPTSSGDGSGGRGAGINNTGMLTMTNCVVAGNRVQSGPRPGNNEGGGIYNGGTLTLTNVTVVFNDGLTASEVFNAGAADVMNSIIAAPFNSGADTAGPFNSRGGNLVGYAGGSTGFTNGVNGDIVGTSSNPINPRLGAFANYGGNTSTYPLLPGSPAIDAGVSAGAPAQDQRGVGRVGAVDIGSFESRGFSIAATGGTPQSATIGSFFNSSLQATVSSAFGEPVGGGSVTFNAPTTGPSATFGNTNSTTRDIGAGGVVSSLPPLANGLAGSYLVTAGGNGIANTASFSLTNNRASTATGVSSSLNPSVFGQSVRFNVIVTSVAVVPTGTVQFKDNGVDIGGPVTLGSGGSASITTSALANGTHVITAAYSGDANHLASEGTLPGGQKVMPTISIDDVNVAEGDTGTTDAVFTVTLSSATPATVTVNYITNGGTAASPADYQSANGTLTFDPGQTTKTITVTVKGDTAFEEDETFFVSLSGAQNAAFSDSQGKGTILNDDGVGFSQSVYTVNERDGFVAVTVRRNGDTSQAAGVDYATDDGGTPSVAVPCSSVTGLALERCDYTRAAGTLNFAAGETEKTVTVLVNEDSYVEGTETTHLRLSNPVGVQLAGQSSATLQITDDTQQTTNPVDDAQFFVRQHYHDFLNREPDADGFAFWTGQMTNCSNPPPADLTVCKINVSAAFFQSIEFQQTGYLVERVYKVAYGDATGTSTLGGAHQLAVPVVSLNEFLPGTQRIGLGVVVGQGNWPQQLESNKAAYALEFVSGQRFTNAFPASMTAQEFVSRLNTNSGGVLTSEEVAQLVALFGGPSATSNDAAKRAQVLRAVAENATLQQREFNRAFVLMQYFGYLRRNPSDAPDTDYTGYDFWLSKLDEFQGNFVQAEMVKAFIQSDEYRHRFGQ